MKLFWGQLGKPALLQMSQARVLPGLVEQKLNLIVLGKTKKVWGIVGNRCSPSWTRLDSGGREGWFRSWQGLADPLVGCLSCHICSSFNSLLSTRYIPGAVQKDIQDLRVHLWRLETEEKNISKCSNKPLTSCCNCKVRGRKFEEVQKGRPPRAVQAAAYWSLFLRSRDAKIHLALFELWDGLLWPEEWSKMQQKKENVQNWICDWYVNVETCSNNWKKNLSPLWTFKFCVIHFSTYLMIISPKIAVNITQKRICTSI